MNPKPLSLAILISLTCIILLMPLDQVSTDGHLLEQLQNASNATHPQANAVLDNTLEYFKGEAELQYFTEQERAHILDVKLRLGTGKLLFWLSLLVFFTSIILLRVHEKGTLMRRLSRVFFAAGAVGLLLDLVLGFAAMDFGGFFSAFHTVFFPGGNYTFPATSELIMAFPARFFYLIGVNWFTAHVMLNVSVMLIGYVGLRRRTMHRSVKYVKKSIGKKKKVKQ